MAKLPQPEVTTVTRIYAALERQRRSGFRPHLGASLIGRECERALWYTFRWATRASFPGRILRLFRRGFDEERRLVEDLRAAGVEAWDRDPSTGRQFHFSAVGGHVGGSMDGVGRGLEEAPKTEHVLEFKTHARKSYEALERDGVQKSKPEHWAQCQLYMHWSGLTRAAYLAVCKDDDRIYLERIHYDQAAALELEAKARRIVEAPEPPPGVSDQAEYYLCRWCDHRQVCHEGRLPEVHCRSCAHATPVTDGSEGAWTCARWGEEIPPTFLERGCDEHVFIPQLTPWTVVDANAEAGWIEYALPGGERLRNGPRAVGYPSREIRAAQGSGDVCVLFDEAVVAARDELDAEVTE